MASCRCTAAGVQNMKDELKDFVDRNRQAFDDKEVPEGAWAQIDGSLPRMKSASLWGSVAVWRAAAVLLFGLSAWLFVTRPAQPARKEVAVQGEFTDLESYYSRQIAEKVALIDDFDASGDMDAFTPELHRLDAMYQVLREEMKNHPSQKVRDALVLNMLVRIDLLNQQIKKLEDSKRPPSSAVSMI